MSANTTPEIKRVPLEDLILQVCVRARCAGHMLSHAWLAACDAL